MAPRPRDGRGRGLRRLAVLLLPCLLARGIEAAPPASPEPLPLGEARERPIAAGEAQVWRLEVAAGEALLLTVEEKDISLRVEVRAEGGEPLAAGGIGRWEPVALVLPPATGAYRIEVRPREASAWPGRYAIRVEKAPAAGERRDALDLMSRAGREALPDTPEARKQAEAAYRAALAAWRAQADRAGEADALTRLAMLEAVGSELGPAARDLAAATALWRELGQPRREAEATNWLGVVELDTRAAGKARETLEESLSLWHGQGAPYDEAETRGNLCNADYRLGEIPAAIACYQESLALFRQIGDKAQEGTIENNLGVIEDDLGEPDQALDFYQQALDLRRALGDRRGQAETLGNIAVVHRTLGEWQEALRIYREEREILTPSGDRALQATLSNNLGFVYNSLGEPRQALGFLEEALRLRRETGQRSAEVVTRNILGAAWRQLGEAEKAVDQHRQALALATSLGDTRAQAVSRRYLAEVYLDRGDAAAALRELDAALPAAREKGDRAAESAMLDLRGRSLAAAGRPREARAAFDEALALRRALRDRAGEAATLAELAAAERADGSAADALSHAEAAVARVEELRTGFLSPDLRTSFLATRQRAFSLLAELWMDRDTAAPGQGYDREAFAVSERARARTLLDVLRAGGGASAAPPELVARRSALLRRLSDKVDRRAAAGGAKAASLEREIDGLVAEVGEVEAEIRARDPRLAAWSAPPPATLAEVSGGLDPGTMLVEYSLGEARSFLWAIDRAGDRTGGGGRLRSFVLPARREIEALARRAYDGMSTVEAGSARRDDAAETLARTLLGPIWGDVAGLRRLVVVPDGALALLPFAALPVPTPGASWQAAATREPLVSRLEVDYVPSATTLAVERRRLLGRAPAARLAAVLADPVFAADDPRLAQRSTAQPAAGGRREEETLLRGDVFERLPATRREAEALAGLAPPGAVSLALGLAANRDAVLGGSLRGFRVLHFATHAVADALHPELSGLMLSRVDASGRPRQGFVGLADLYDLDLDADLVVLSGCETALGKEVRGEGLLGLTRGFQYAGVPRVVASLWRVEDRATAELMTRFYRAMWRDHLPPAAALRAAQLALRREPRYRDPHSWAGFVLQGDWR